MNKQKKILTALFGCCLAFALGAGTLVSGTNAQTASAATETETLFMPETYEQYLPLDNPTDVALSDSYIAVADGNLIYLYNRAEESYSCYTHTVNGESRSVSKLQFASDGRLFFSDYTAQMYLYSFSESAAIQQDISCSTFVLEGDMLYTAIVTGSAITFYAIPVTGTALSFDQAVLIHSLASSEMPRMACSNGVLYCFVGYSLYQFSYNGTSYSMSLSYLSDENGTIVSKLSSLCVFDGQLYFTVKENPNSNGLYRASLSSSESANLFSGEDASELDGFSALTTYGGNLYCIKDCTVRELDITDNEATYTGYVIGAGADTLNRVSEATETARGGELLAIADSGNDRIVVYDLETETYSSIRLDGAPTCVATDGEIIAVGVGGNVLLYEYGETDPYLTLTSSIGNSITGVTLVYGTCYYITDHSYGNTATGAEITRANTPTAVTSDLWGNIYVADSSRCITKYTEDEFKNYLLDGETLNWTLPSSFCSLRADFDGNLYYLSGNVLYQNGMKFIETYGGELVYRGENAAENSPVSFALGFEDGTIWYQYGDYMTRAVYGVPSLSSISAESAAETIFSVPQASELSFTEVKENAVCISVDIQSLTENSEYFSFAGYEQSAGGRGIVLAETDKYSLVILYQEFSYTIGLFLTEDCSAFSVSLTEANGDAYYLSNAVTLSYYPCLDESLSQTTLPRAAEVRLLCTLPLDGNEYAYVSYEMEGTVIYGYVPASYLISFTPEAAETDEYTLGYLKANSSGVVFRNADGDRYTVTQSVAVKIYDTDDGYYIAELDINGVAYTAQVTADQLISGNTEALRTSLIIVLCVVAVGMLALYALWLWDQKKNKREWTNSK